MSAQACGYCKRDLSQARQAGHCLECQLPLCVVCYAQGQRTCQEHKAQARQAAYFTCDRCSKRFPAAMLAGQCQGPQGPEGEACDRPVCRNCQSRFSQEGRLLCRFHQPNSPPVLEVGQLPANLRGASELDREQVFLLTSFFGRLDRKMAEVQAVMQPRTGQLLKLNQFPGRQPTRTTLEMVYPARNNQRGLGLLVSVNFTGEAGPVQAAIESALKLTRQEPNLDVFLVVVSAGVSWSEQAHKWFDTFEHSDVTLAWLEWQVNRDRPVKADCKYRHHPAFQSLLGLFHLEMTEEMVKRAIDWLRQDTDWLLGARSFSQEEIISSLELNSDQVQIIMDELVRRQIGRIDRQQGEVRLAKARLLF